jgi:hypothetical protein
MITAQRHVHVPSPVCAGSAGEQGCDQQAVRCKRECIFLISPQIVHTHSPSAS